MMCSCAGGTILGLLQVVDWLF